MKKADRLLLFLDTEFTDFKELDLVSIGLVSIDQHEFYGENAEYIDSFCTDFCRKEVLPKLHGSSHALPYCELKASLQHWLTDLLTDYLIVRVVFDYAGDWYLLGELLANYPHKKMIEGVQDNFDTGIELYFQDRRDLQHHALNDARALRHAFTEKYGSSLPY